jgi:ribosomal protein S18 acetylase RimI-like enzyme
VDLKIYIFGGCKMISESLFNEIAESAKKYKYSSMNYIDYKDCSDAEVLYKSNSLILLKDESKTPTMLYFAVDDFESLIKIITDMPGRLRMHFVPREFATQLKNLGFIEWGEYTDFWNENLADTSAHFGSIGETEYLSINECEDASIVSQKCRLQSRGFEGESPKWFKEWLSGNEVIVWRNESLVAGFCCVSIYNGGTTLWIREIAVDPAHQGTGIGKKLMEKAISYGVGAGAIKGFLAADILNENAISLYKKYDFLAKNNESELQMIRE